MELFILLPQFLLLKSPKELETVNQQLKATLAEQLLAEKDLEESRRTFRGAFDDAPIGMALVSLEGNFLKVNKALVRMLGYSNDELLSTNFQAITHPDDLGADLALMDELTSDERRFYRLEKRYYHKLGHVVSVELSVALLRDSKDSPLYFVAHVQDVSQQKRANVSLIAATQAAEAANEAKSEFLAMMSHEIRTPMNAMIGMAELLEETKLDRQQQDYAKVIRTSGGTLLTVVNDILDFSKIESSNLELEMTRLDLYECVEDVISLFSIQAEEKQLALTSLIEPANRVHLTFAVSINT
ncbi:MAG: PAS domain S-box protein [Phormidesmis sp.]